MEIIQGKVFWIASARGNTLHLSVADSAKVFWIASARGNTLHLSVADSALVALKQGRIGA